MSPRRRQRWPRFVYDAGEEPDYRFSFANERTYLAWIRTALALLAAGAALDVVDVSIDEPLKSVLAVVLAVLGLACAVAAWVRWALAERAMRARGPLPSFGSSAFLTLTLLAVGATTAAAITFAR